MANVSIIKALDPDTGEVTSYSINDTAAAHNTATGNKAISIDEAAASGNYAVAIGNEAIATGLRGVAIGHTANAAGSNPVAIGYATALGNGISIGYEAYAYTHAIAMGCGSEANASTSIAIGRLADASASFSVAFGYDCKASANNSIAIGRLANASSLESIAIGRSANATGANSIAIGRSANASSYAIAFGPSSNAGLYSTAIGDSSNASGNFSMALGESAVASNINAIAIGRSANASGANAIAIGRSANATGTSAIAIGAVDNADAGTAKIRAENGVYIVRTSESSGLDEEMFVPMIQYGKISIYSTANTPTAENVTFDIPFQSTPYVFVTPQTSVPGTTVLGVGATNTTTEGCKVYITRTTATNTSVYWMAVGY